MRLAFLVSWDLGLEELQDWKDIDGKLSSLLVTTDYWVCEVGDY